MNSTVLTPDDQNVAHDTIDGEVIVVHFANGIYYSLRNTAAQIWHWLVQSHTTEQVVEHLAAQYDNVDRDVIRAFIQQLQDEQLMKVMDAPAVCTALESANIEYAAPVLERHNDLEQLIKLDPIHEVEAAGWPKRIEG